MQDDISKFLDIFLESNRENLTSLENELVEMERAGANQERSECIMRLLHTVKGSCSMFGLHSASSIAHALEDLTTTIIKENADMQAAADLLFDGADKLRARIEQYAISKTEETTPETEFFLRVAEARDAILLRDASIEHIANKLLDALDMIPDFVRDTFETSRIDEAARQLRIMTRSNSTPETLNSDEASEHPDQAIRQAKSILAKCLQKTARDDEVQDFFIALADVLEQARPQCSPELLELCDEAEHTVEMLRERMLPMDILMHEYFAMLLEDLTVSQRPGNPDLTIEKNEEENSPVRPNEAPGFQKTIRVEETKIDTFLDSVGELIVVAEVYKYLQRQLETGGMTDAVMRELKSTNTSFYENVFELQLALMEVRRVSLTSIYSLLPRLVRDSAQEAHKDVELVLEGEQAVVDKALLDRVEACLVQLLRNCVAHGIEQPQKRIEAGKPARGRITASAKNEGKFLVLEVSDDGGGLNVNKIRQRAVENGFLTRERVEAMSDREASLLIFQSGLSTSDGVDMVSGRGVGLDVVAEEVQMLGGAVNVDTEPGKGTTVTIRMPLNITLSVMQGIVAKVGDTAFIIPASAVLESVYPTHEMITSVEHKGEVIMLRGEMMRLSRIGDTLAIPNAQTDPTKAVVTILQRKEQRAAFMFDSLQDLQQVVVKNIMGLNLPSQVSGAALLGDGQIGLVLDLDGLFILP